MDESTTEPATDRADQRPWWRRHLVLLLGAACVVLGVVVTLTTPAIVVVPIPTMGWAESVASTSVPPPGAAFWQEQPFVGGAIAALGCVLLAAYLGYRAGLKRARRPLT